MSGTVMKVSKDQLTKNGVIASVPLTTSLLNQSYQEDQDVLIKIPPNDLFSINDEYLIKAVLVDHSVIHTPATKKLSKNVEAELISHILIMNVDYVEISSSTI